MRRLITILTFITLTTVVTFGQSYTFDDFVGTWEGFYSYENFGGGFEELTMTIEPDGFYTETSGYFMPPYYYPNTQSCDYDEATNRFHMKHIETVYAGQTFYQHYFYEVVYFQNDTLEMHYNYWDDPEPHPETGTLFLVRATITNVDDGQIDMEPQERKLMKVYNIMGQEVPSNTKGQILIYLYSDGYTEKKFIR
jgi:hypothetical protein